MKSLLNFFIKTGKLKTSKRKGWLLYKIKNPSTTADHLFRAAILGWALNKEKGLDEEKVIKSILVHHLPDVYLGEEPPYDALLSKDILAKGAKNKKRAGLIFQKFPQLSLRAAKKKAAQRQVAEEKSLKRLIAKLPAEAKKEIEELWKEQSRKRTKLAKFSWQVGKLESYLQALEYAKSQGKVQENLWARWMRRHLKDPVVAKMRAQMYNLFLRPKKRRPKTKMVEVLQFIIEVGKLKRLKRTGWVLARVKNAETVAQHTYQMCLMAWFLGGLKGLNTKRIVKLALAHDLCEVYAGDQTPYDPILAANKGNIEEMVSKPARMPYPQRLEWLMEKVNKEWKALVKLTSNLPKGFQEELVNLWIDFEEGFSKEGRFVRQVDQLVNLFQAIEYWKKDKSFPITPWWIMAREKIDDPLLLKFMEELDKEFSIANNKQKKRKTRKTRKTRAKIKR